MPSSSSFRSDLLKKVSSEGGIVKTGDLPGKWAVNAFERSHLFVFSNCGFTIIKTAIVSENE